MREFEDGHPLDGGDGNPDAPSPKSGDSQQHHEAVPDAAVRRASALEYRQRVDAEYAAYYAEHGKPASPQEQRAPGLRDQADSDRGRVRQLYAEYLADRPRNGHDQGISTVGPQPDRSPDEISDRPPSGSELVEMEATRKSRLSGLLQETEKAENLDNLNDAVEETANSVQRWLSARPPQGHAEQHVPASSPYISPSTPEHGIESGSAATALLFTGILTVHTAHWVEEQLRHWKDEHHAGNR